MLDTKSRLNLSYNTHVFFFYFALYIGFLYFILFLLGVTGLFYQQAVSFISFISFLLFLFLQRKEIVYGARRIGHTQITSKLACVLFLILIVQGGVNFIGVLGPELSFDALWYHLTLSKLFLLSHAVYHIPGGLLYYSDMPKLGELLYAVGLSMGNEIFVKFIHFFFGILTTAAIYYFARKFVTPLFALVAAVIFYSNLVVAWESTTAYVDLIRAFFEILALWSFINWQQTKKERWFYLAACMVGLAIATKLLAVGSLLIFLVLIAVALKVKRLKELGGRMVLFGMSALLIPLPWLIFAYVHTGNPVYPFFSDLYKISPEPLSLFGAIKDIWMIFTQAADPISPVYIILFPLLFVTYKKLSLSVKYIVWYSLLATVMWYFTPRTGGGRFLVPYLPALSIVCAIILSTLLNKKSFTKSPLVLLFISVIIFVSILSISYRFVANSKYIPVITGQQTKHDFLSNNLNFSFGDFYDTDGYFSKNITSSDTVLLYGFHNLYYVDFSFIDSSWVKPGDKFTYVAVQNAALPEKFKDWQLVYTNAKTMVKLYKPPSTSCKNQCVY